MNKNQFRKMNNELLFSEQQRFKQIWLWILMLGINVIAVYGFVGQVFLGHPLGTNPMSNTMMVFGTLLTFLPTILFFYMRLETKIKTDGIYVRFFPIHLRFKFYSWDRLNQSFVRAYSPIGEFGGWGMRGIGKNKALNISGNKGIQIVTTDGAKLLIGTDKPDEVTTILKQLGHLTKE